MTKIPAVTLFAALATASIAAAQHVDPPMQVPKVVPVPPLRRTAPLKEPTDPPARDVADPQDRLTYHLSAGWNLASKDGEVSVFRLDARTAPRRSRMRSVATLAFNPYPQSTFAGAAFYVSATPHMTAEACAAETTAKPSTGLPPVVIDDVKFARGKDEHGHICTEARDVAYTALRRGTCVRLDLTINSFCGGEVSGAEDLNEDQLQRIYDRLQRVALSVRFVR